MRRVRGEGGVLGSSGVLGNGVEGLVGLVVRRGELGE